MAVPAGVKYKKPENVCFACDFTNIADHFQIEALGALIREMHAQLHVLNVDFKNKHSEATLRTTELHQGLSALDPVYHYVEKEHIDEGIRDFVEANHMDWLMIVPHKHSFWEGLFHKSHTKALVKLSHIPIVALHERAGIKKEH
jgi:nucleotide-binding universal stress UspA family protein